MCLSSLDERGGAGGKVQASVVRDEINSYTSG